MSWSGRHLERSTDDNRPTTIHEVSDLVPTPRDDDTPSLPYQVSGVSQALSGWLILLDSTALIICCFNDGNSFFQVILCGTMWGLNRYCSHRFACWSVLVAEVVFLGLSVPRGRLVA